MQIHASFVRSDMAVERVVERRVEVPAAQKAWLVFGIPTVPRRVDYLTRTLDYILEQVPADPSHPMYGKVAHRTHPPTSASGSSFIWFSDASLVHAQLKVVVMNNAKGKRHDAFERNKKRLDPASHPKGSYVEFMVNPNKPIKATPQRVVNVNVPSAKVRMTAVTCTVGNGTVSCSRSWMWIVSVDTQSTGATTKR